MGELLKECLEELLNSNIDFVEKNIDMEKRRLREFYLFILSFLLFLLSAFLKIVVLKTSAIISIIGCLITPYLIFSSYIKLKIQRKRKDLLIEIKRKIDNNEEITISEFREFNELIDNHWKSFEVIWEGQNEQAK